MKSASLHMLRSIALLFLLPGLGGVVISAAISTHYLNTLPRVPVLEDGREVPRSIDGVTIFQTKEEDRRLSLLEYGSVGIFVVGFLLGVVYLEKWGSTQSRNNEEDGFAENES